MPAGGRIVADNQWRQDAGADDRISVLLKRLAIADLKVVVLLALIDFQNEAGGREHVRWQMRRVGVAHDHGGEGIVLHFAEQMQAVEPLQVIEAITVLQLLHLHLEDEVEGRAQHAAEGHDFFGKSADPQIDVVQAAERSAGIGVGRVEEIDRRSTSKATSPL